MRGVQRLTSCVVCRPCDPSAFGAHALRSKLTPYQQASWTTAAQYQLLHSLALLVASTQPASQAVQVARYAFAAGITLFSGSIYGLCLTSDDANGIRKFLGPVTPLGGTAFIVGWIGLAMARRGIRLT